MSMNISSRSLSQGFQRRYAFSLPFSVNVLTIRTKFLNERLLLLCFTHISENFRATCDDDVERGSDGIMACMRVIPAAYISLEHRSSSEVAV